MVPIVVCRTDHNMPSTPLHYCAPASRLQARSPLAAFLPAFGLALTTTLLLLVLGLRPGPAGSAVAAIYPPGTTSAEAFARVVAAGGTPIRGGAFANIMIARADDDILPSRLRAHGAWLVVDAIALAACLPQ